ncbi:MAG: DUF5671 domain-containing protein [Candidatus Eremiobacteraeota bacterium]|nr:DUF5671 domain-containing protein [Candidatus Eremiobacteraeota bacterium]
MPQVPDSPESLLEFIRAAKAHGVTDDFAARLLKYNGWSDRSIFQAYSAYYGQTLGNPVPSRGNPIEYARDAFFYLLAFITLGFWTFALGNLFYNLIDRLAYDPLSNGQWSAAHSNISFDVASMLVTFPIFLWMTWIIQRETARRPETLDSGVRKWLTYLALVIAASSLMGDAVWFLQQFLSGSLSQAFVLKSLVLVVIAGGVFVYYLGAVRADSATVARDRIFAGIAVLAVAIGIIAGFSNNGSPSAQRERAFDEIRTRNLNQIENAVSARWRLSRPSRLPARLIDLPNANAMPHDPETHAPYGYRIIAGSRYTLCATFATSTTSDPEARPWQHNAGRACFDLDATVPPN